MATKTFTTDLKVGMFVADLDRPWVDTPFLLQGFLVEDEEQIATLRTHCEYVMVDRARSIGDQYEAAPPTPTNTVPPMGARKDPMTRAELAAATPSKDALPPDSAARPGAPRAPTRDGKVVRLEEISRRTVGGKYAGPYPEAHVDDGDGVLGRMVSGFKGLFAGSKKEKLSGSSAGPSAAPPIDPGAETPQEFEARAALLPPGIEVQTYVNQTTVEEEAPRAREVVTQATNLLEKLVSDIKLGQSFEVERVEEIVDDMVESIVRNPQALMWVARLREQDITTYGHGLQVSVYLTVVRPPPRIPAPAAHATSRRSACCSTSARSACRESLLEKQGRLTDEEFEAAKAHVALGLEILAETPDFDAEILRGIEQHHERMNGSGYPRAPHGRRNQRLRAHGGHRRLLRRAHQPSPLRGRRVLLRGAAQHHRLGRRVLPRSRWSQQFVSSVGVFPGGLADRAVHRARWRSSSTHSKVRRLKPRVLVVTGPGQDAGALPDDGRPALRAEDGRSGGGIHQARARARRLWAEPVGLLPRVTVSASPPPAAIPEVFDPGARDELLRQLDRESAIARATDGRLAVLVIELRRVDRLQALLKGPAPATTMGLVLDRLRKALRPEDRIAALSDEQVCIVLPRLAHPSQAVLAAVKLLRALDRPIAHEGGSAVLRPCVGVATLPEHGFDPAGLLMAADVARHIAATREEGYHVMLAEDRVETEVYRGLDLDLERAIRANELEMHYQPQHRAGLRPPRGRGGAGALAPPQGGRCRRRHHHRHRRAHRPHRLAHVLDPQCGAAPGVALAHGRRGAAASAMNLSLANPHRPRAARRDRPELKTWSVPAGEVVLEITESTMIVDAERSMAILTRLKGVGVQISHRRFRHRLLVARRSCKRLPVDELKIDRLVRARHARRTAATGRSCARSSTWPTTSSCASWPRASRTKPRSPSSPAWAATSPRASRRRARPLPERRLRDWWTTPRDLKSVWYKCRHEKGFYTIMAAQFFSSLADNALLIAAIALLAAARRPGVAHAAAQVLLHRLLRGARRSSSAPSPTRCPRAG